MKVDSQNNSIGDQLVRVRRPHEYEDLSRQYRLRLRCYDRQFSNIYAARISEARRKIEKVAQHKWGKEYSIYFMDNNIV